MWATYSLGYVNRDDGEQVYPTHFERRHNINLLVSYALGRSWELGARWNYGSGFPFTLTQGFYGQQDILGGIDSDVITLILMFLQETLMSRVSSILTNVIVVNCRITID
jgi:hypothetical protein